MPHGRRECGAAASSTVVDLFIAKCHYFRLFSCSCHTLLHLVSLLWLLHKPSERRAAWRIYRASVRWAHLAPRIDSATCWCVDRQRSGMEGPGKGVASSSNSGHMSVTGQLVSKTTRRVLRNKRAHEAHSFQSQKPPHCDNQPCGNETATTFMSASRIRQRPQSPSPMRAKSAKRRHQRVMPRHSDAALQTQMFPELPQLEQRRASDWVLQGYCSDRLCFQCEKRMGETERRLNTWFEIPGPDDPKVCNSCYLGWRRCTGLDQRQPHRKCKTALNPKCKERVRQLMKKLRDRQLKKHLPNATVRSKFALIKNATETLRQDDDHCHWFFSVRY